jgi:hypothetical protein
MADNNATGHQQNGGGGEGEVHVTAHTYGALDTSRVDDECWMIRIPSKVAELWERAEEGTNLGELVFTKGGDNLKPSFAIHVSESLVKEQQARHATTAGRHSKKASASSSAIPLNYSLQAMTKKVPVMHPFTRNPVDGSVQLLGTVTRTANMQVEAQDSKYRALLKDRLVATALTSSRFVKPVEATESIVARQSGAAAAAAGTAATGKKESFGDAVFQCGKRKLEQHQQDASLRQQTGAAAAAAAAAKKARQFAPDQPLRSVIFELFSDQEYWTVKGLRAAAIAGGCSQLAQMTAKRAESDIRDILRDEIGQFHRSGDHRNKWELRKEFQQQTAEQNE